jgi:hypothetical protein
VMDGPNCALAAASAPKESLPLKYPGEAMTIGATIEIHPYPAVIQVSLTPVG